MTNAVTPRKPPSAGRKEAYAAWRFIDAVLVGCVLAISTLGVLMIYSATRRNLAAEGLNQFTMAGRQAVFVLIGIALMAIIASIDYQNLRGLVHIAYVGVIGLLLLLIPLGKSTNATQAWFQLGPFQLQPSEIAKVVVIMALAAYAAMGRGEMSTKRVGIALGIAAIPMALIYLQGDLGTALVFIAVIFGILVMGGARARDLLALAGIGVVGIVLVLQLGILKDYQVDRLTAFLDPAQDQQETTYNLNQSKIAIGSGGVAGKGLFQGSQTNLSYVPEQPTDFIFTAVGEELGFVGSASLLALFGILVWRIWRAAALSRDEFGTLLCVGVLAMFVFQIFENVGMTMGIMPITGIPLPFMSYGGSAVLASFIAVGLVLNVSMRRFR